MTPNTLQEHQAAFTGEDHIGKWYAPNQERLHNPQHRIEHQQSDTQTFEELGEIAELTTVAPNNEVLDPEDHLGPETIQAVNELLYSGTPESKKVEILESLWQQGGKSAVISVSIGNTLDLGRFKLKEEVESLEPNLDVKLSDLLVRDERDAEILAEVAALDTRLNEQLQKPVFEEEQYFDKGKLSQSGAASLFNYEAQRIAGEIKLLSMTGSEVVELMSSFDPLDQELGAIIENDVSYDKDWNSLLAAKLDEGIPLADRQQTVENFITAGHGTVAIDTCLEAFPDLDNKAIALKLIATDQGSAMTSGFEKFQGVNQQEVFKALDQSGQLATLAYNLNKFTELDVTEVALALVWAGRSFDITVNHENFSSGNHEVIVDAAISSGDDSILNNLEAFADVDQNALVKRLETDCPEWHTSRLRHFHDLDPAIALEVAKRRPESIMHIFEAIDSFSTLNDPDFIDAVLLSGGTHYLIQNIEKIAPEDPSQIIDKVLASSQPWTLIDAVDDLHLDKARLVGALVREGQLTANGALEKLAPFDSQTALELYKANPHLFLAYIENFELSNATYLLMVAEGLYAKSSPYEISSYSEKIQGVDAEVLTAVTTEPSQSAYLAQTYMLSHRSEFPQITDEKIIEIFASSYRVHELLNLSEDNIDFKKVADYLMNEGDYIPILHNPDKFDFLDNQKLYDGLLESENYGLIIAYQDRFEQYDPKVIFADLLEKGKSDVIVGSIDHFAQYVDNDAIDNFAVSLFSSNDPEVATAKIASILNQMIKFELPQLGKVLLEHKQGKLLVMNSGTFPNVTNAEIYDTLVEQGDFGLIVSYSRQLNLGTEQVFNVLIDNGEFGIVERNIPRFTQQLTTETIELLAQSSGNLKHLMDSLDRAGINESALPRSLTLAVDIGGEFANNEIVTTITNILSGQEILDPGLRSLGVTKKGEGGVEQFKAGLNKFTERIMTTGQIDIAQVLGNPVLQSTLMRLTRYDNSAYGVHDQQSFRALLTNAQQGREGVSIETIAPSTVSVAMLDKEARAAFEVSEDGAIEWRTYVSQLNRAKAILKEDGTLNTEELSLLLGEVELLVSNRAEAAIVGTEKIRQKITAKPELADKLQPKLEEQLALIESLKQIDRNTLMNFDTFFTHIQTLAPFKEMHGPIGTMMTVAALGQSGRRPDPEVKVDENGMPISPTLDEINEMADFVGRITNQETWGSLYSPMGESKAIDTILSTNALTGNIRRAETISTSGSMPLQLITTNGPLMELSGHIGDACWANKYGSIAESFPNFSSVIMVQNAGTKHARFAGSTMLIEASSNNGEPLLIIRGLNPIQNVITQLSTAEFLDKFIVYVKQIAENSGRRVALVIDDHSGGSGTNRPDLHEAMVTKSATLPKVSINPNDLTTFNSYDISQKTYYV